MGTRASLAYLASSAMTEMNQADQLNQTIQMNNLHGYALRIRSRHGKLVHEQLVNQGIEQLLPTVKRLSQWKDRKKEIEVVRGPLQGVRGLLLRKEKRHRLVLGVRLIEQAAAVEIDVKDVLPA